MVPTTDLRTTPPTRASEPAVQGAPFTRSSSNWLGLWATIGVIAALASAFTIGRTTGSVDISVVATNGPTQPQAAPVARAPAVPALPPVAVDGTNRIAAVASAAAPSVVQLETADGLGSGVIYDESGLILTAAHVVADSDTVAVRLADGRLFDAEVVGRHVLTDIAVLRIRSEGSFPTAVLGYNDQLQVGELAVALGSPFGLDQTVTAGIVSAVSRMVNGVPMVQTDAAINPGNSGGPLLDINAHVIGINDVIFTQGGGSDGIGFAVSIDIAIVVADQLVAGRDVQLSGLGLSTIASTTGEGGAIVREVLPGSPAEAAGLEIGDRIVAIDSEPINNPMQLFAAVVTRRPGTAITVDFVRNDSQQQIEAELVGIEA